MISTWRTCRQCRMFYQSIIGASGNWRNARLRIGMAMVGPERELLLDTRNFKNLILVSRMLVANQAHGTIRRKIVMPMTSPKSVPRLMQLTSIRRGNELHWQQWIRLLFQLGYPLQR